MSSRRRAVVTAALVGASVAVTGGLVALAAQSDPTETVSPISIPSVRMTSPSASASTPPADREVVGLDRLDGTVTRSPGDPDDLLVRGVELSFGPDAWVRTAGPTVDLDRDGSAESLRVELDGLVGQSVRALVRFDSDGDEASAYVINDQVYRDPAGASPPWTAQPPSTASPAPQQAVRKAAAAAMGAGARVDELERVTAGAVVWEATVLDRTNREFTVLLDRSGRVLDVQADG